ncbi:TIGR03560 family F420-dependent LLM class oxidoreductase [Agromyces atrinae]|uniref:F420-dependent oxidoreductase-like protein n=1 Tax=Agromyces atrinae TaxID=592376 RepID=A0A4Q2MGJ7_9MICO|nr:TIGR03560 family F420-dependent LLM class oxidoreductase [Agromyces atrinae]NYD67501.1 F420-dependent oxidoreductase-like protein [Agromyces atrinae]RXZ88280.1 TIGR03560 family F420-dependent LLM class oxidoreductase [Agromyces atrinae]
MRFRIFTEPQQGASYDDQVVVAQTAERLGFDAFFRSDHFLSMGEGDGLPGPTDSWVTLGAIARETSTIRLGTLVSSATFRHPGLLAIQVAQVDAMSGGRAELGLGTGWFAEEHAAYGIPFPEKRFGILEEQLEVITGLWSTPVGERYSFAGEHYTLVDSPALPKPVQSPVPVVVGGGGPKRTPRVAARFASEFNIGFTLDPKPAFDRVRAACDEIGRDPESLHYSSALTTAVGADDAEYARRVRAIGREPETFRENSLGGTPQQVIDTIGRLADDGVDTLYVQIMDLHDLDHLELIAAEVLPAFA